MSPPIIHEPDQIIAQLLVAAGQGSDPTPMLTGGTPSAWPVFYSKEPDRPDNVITVYHTADRQDYREMVEGEQQEHLGIQVRVRASDNPTAKGKARTVRDWMTKTAYLNHVTLTSPLPSAVYLVWAFTGFNLQDLGDNAPSTKRNISTINCMVAITRLS